MFCICIKKELQIFLLMLPVLVTTVLTYLNSLSLIQATVNWNSLLWPVWVPMEQKTAVANITKAVTKARAHTQTHTHTQARTHTHTQTHACKRAHMRTPVPPAPSRTFSLRLTRAWPCSGCCCGAGSAGAQACFPSLADSLYCQHY